jgi:hypothetical protein
LWENQVAGQDNATALGEPLSFRVDTQAEAR